MDGLCSVTNLMLFNKRAFFSTMSHVYVKLIQTYMFMYGNVFAGLHKLQTLHHCVNSINPLCNLIPCITYVCEKQG